MKYMYSDMIPDPDWMRREKTRKNGRDYEKDEKRG